MFSLNKIKINLNQELGNGRFGSVYAYQKIKDDSKHDSTDDQWAVKIMTTKKIEEFIKQHLQEIVLGFSFDHPNVISVKGFHVDFEGKEEIWRTYLKLPRMTSSLKSKLTKQENSKQYFTEEQIVRYFYGLTSGLQYLHKRGIAHRDIKPANLLIDKDDEIKIGDVGIGIFIGDETSYDLKEFPGTRDYSAPEILDGNPHLKKKDLFKADIWSLGVVMAELCLLEMKIFDSNELSQKNQAQLDQRLMAIEKKGYNKVLRDLISSLLQYDPLKRRSLEEVQRILEQNFPFLLKRLDKEVQTRLDLEIKELVEKIDKEIQVDFAQMQKEIEEADFEKSTLIKVMTDSASDHKLNNGGSHSHKNHNHRRRPLLLSSPSFDAIKIAQAKSLAHKIFNRKFESEIFQYVLELTDEANKMRDYCIIAYHRLDYCITSLFPSLNVQTKIFGSCATGLALPTSDVDILVSGLGTYDDRFYPEECLLIISDTLDKFKWITSNEPILTATVPILKLALTLSQEIDLKIKFNELKESMPDGKIWGISTDKKEKLNIQNIEGKDDDIKIRVDLSLESFGMGDLHLGYKTTAFVQKMLQKYTSLYTVTMFLKEFLNNRKLLNIYKGGVSSYCLVIMIVALFNKFKDEGCMASLWRFFNFYGEVFKPEATGISLIEKEPFFPLTQSYGTAPLWIIADTNMFNRKNIGIGVYSIKTILNEFAKASQIIEHYRKSFEEIAVRYSEAITSVEDFSKIENDPDLKKLMSTNIAKLIVRDT